MGVLQTLASSGVCMEQVCSCWVGGQARQAVGAFQVQAEHGAVCPTSHLGVSAPSWFGLSANLEPATFAAALAGGGSTLYSMLSGSQVALDGCVPYVCTRLCFLSLSLCCVNN